MDKADVHFDGESIPAPVHVIFLRKVPTIVSTGCANCGTPVDYREGEDDGPLFCERCGI
jgi:DNA-directed RNA polymerase subunit RPC12/RpoP